MRCFCYLDIRNLIYEMAFFMLLVVLGASAVASQECEVCPDRCTCTSGRLDCDHLGLASVFACGKQPIRDADFSHNDIEIIHWDDLPNISDSSSCYIRLESNNINSSSGMLMVERCNYLYTYLDYNNLRSLPSEFIVINNLQGFTTSFQRCNIYFRNNEMESISARAIILSASKSIGYIRLYFNNNNIRYIHPDAFALSSTSRTYIYLNNNKIISPSAVFNILTNIPSLTNTTLYLYLSDNLITGLENVEDKDRAVSESGITLYLYLGNNPLHCNCSLHSIGYDNSSIRASIVRSGKDYWPRCATPTLLREMFLPSLAAENFTCFPELDPNAIFEFEVVQGETVVLHCPVIGAYPQIQRYDWIFLPSETLGYVTGGWTLYKETNNKELVVEVVEYEGIFQCRPHFPHSTLSVNISVSVVGPGVTAEVTIPHKPGIATTQETDVVTTTSSMTPPGEGRTTSTLFIIVIIQGIAIIILIALSSLVIIKYHHQLKPASSDPHSYPRPKPIKQETTVEEAKVPNTSTSSPLALPDSSGYEIPIATEKRCEPEVAELTNRISVKYENAFVAPFKIKE